MKKNAPNLLLILVFLVAGCASPADTVVRESPNLSVYRDSIATIQQVTINKN